jgi:hypothetical protein
MNEDTIGTVISSIEKVAEAVIDSSSTLVEGIASTSQVTPQVTPQDNFATYVVYRIFELIFGKVPWFIYRVLTYTFTATVTLDFWGIMYLSIAIGLLLILYMRARIVDSYSRLTPTTLAPRNAFDLKPDATIIDDSTSTAYPGILKINSR